MVTFQKDVKSGKKIYRIFYFLGGIRHAQVTKAASKDNKTVTR
jgi:hypothetical protein